MALLVVGASSLGAHAAVRAPTKPPPTPVRRANLRTPAEIMRHRVTPAMRAAAARRAYAHGLRLPSLTAKPRAHPLTPGGTPDYFGPYPNYANSPLPVEDPTTHVITGGIRKFVDSLPGLGVGGANNLGNYIPIATPDTTTYPGSDYYVIALQRYTQKMHSDLPPTELQGYVQLNNGTESTRHNTIVPPSRPYFMGPLIIAQANRPVRVLFKNELPTGSGGNLFIPLDTTIGGACTRSLKMSMKATLKMST
jgi:hypothetical protein